MKEFLNNYVRELAETVNLDFTKEEFDKLVDRLMDDDNLWETFDDYIVEELEDMVKGE